MSLVPLTSPPDAPPRPKPASWPRTAHYWLVAGGFLLLAVYGSLVPLHRQPLSFAQAVATFREQFIRPAERVSKTDTVVNVALFVPIGCCALGALANRRGRLAALAWAPVVVVACLAASLAIEFAQLWFPPRTASILDVTAQLVGTLLGIGLWLATGPGVHAWLQSLARETHRADLLVWLLGLWVLGLALYSARKFDLTIRPAELAEKYRERLFVLRPFSEATGGRLLADSLGRLAACVPVGMFAAAVGMTPRRPLRSVHGALSVFGALIISGVIVAGIFCLQALARTQETHTSDLITGMLGAAAGIALMVRLRRPMPSATGAEEPRVDRESWVWLYLALGYGALLVVIFCAPFDLSSNTSVMKQRLHAMFTRPPLTSLYASNIVIAVREVVKKVGLFFPLGCLLAAAIRSVPGGTGSRRVRIAAAWTAAAALGLEIELFQIVLDDHTPDLTDAGLYAAGAAAGLWWMLRRRSG